MPGGPLTEPQFAAALRAAACERRGAARYLSQFGIHTDAYRDGLRRAGHRNRGQFDNALQHSAGQLPAARRQGPPRGAGRRAMTVHAPRSAPLLPVSLARFVLAVFGLTTYPPGTSNAVRRPAAQAPGAHPAATQTGD